MKGTVTCLKEREKIPRTYPLVPNGKNRRLYSENLGRGGINLSVDVFQKPPKKVKTQYVKFWPFSVFVFCFVSFLMKRYFEVCFIRW